MGPPAEATLLPGLPQAVWSFVLGAECAAGATRVRVTLRYPIHRLWELEFEFLTLPHPIHIGAGDHGALRGGDELEPEQRRFACPFGIYMCAVIASGPGGLTREVETPLPSTTPECDQVVP